MRSLGLDIGERRIGVALGDPSGILATPLTIIERSGDETTIASIREVVEKYRVARVIIGLPLAPDGGLGMQAQKIKHFAEKLNAAGVSIEYRDERLSTVTARNLMREAAKNRRSRDDAIAAAVILQSYLDESAS